MPLAAAVAVTATEAERATACASVEERTVPERAVGLEGDAEDAADVDIVIGPTAAGTFTSWPSAPARAKSTQARTAITARAARSALRRRGSGCDAAEKPASLITPPGVGIRSKRMR